MPIVDLTGKRFGRLTVLRTIALWAERLSISKSTLGKRLAKGWSIEKALTTKVQVHRKGGSKHATN